MPIQDYLAKRQFPFEILLHSPTSSATRLAHIGSRLASRVPEHFVRPAVAGVMALAGSRLF